MKTSASSFLVFHFATLELSFCAAFDDPLLRSATFAECCGRVEKLRLTLDLYEVLSLSLSLFLSLSHSLSLSLFS